MTINTVNVTFIKMKSSYHCCDAAVKKIVREEWDENSFKMINPVTGELCKEEFDGVNERRLYVSKWEVEGMGVTTDFGAEMDVGEGAIGSDLDGVEYVGAERSDPEIRVVIEVSVAGDVVEEVVTVDESIREEDRSDDEENDEDKKDYICQLLDQRTASQRRDKSCAPSH